MSVNTVNWEIGPTVMSLLPSYSMFNWPFLCGYSYSYWSLSSSPSLSISLCVTRRLLFLCDVANSSSFLPSAILCFFAWTRICVRKEPPERERGREHKWLKVGARACTDIKRRQLHYCSSRVRKDELGHPLRRLRPTVSSQLSGLVTLVELLSHTSVNKLVASRTLKECF